MKLQFKDLERNEFLSVVLKDALEGQHLKKLIKDAIKEPLKSHLQWFILVDLVVTGMQLSPVGDFMKSLKPSKRGTNLGATFYQNVVMLGFSEKLPDGMLDSIIRHGVQELLRLGQLDNTLLVSANTMKQSLECDDLVMDLIPTALESRQLDGILLDMFNEVLQTGDLDDIFMSAARETLQSSNVDIQIKKIMDTLVAPVST